LKYKTSQAHYLDIDNVLFLNPEKYRRAFPNLPLNRETFVSLRTVEDENLFTFQQRVNRGDYKSAGTLFKHSGQIALIALMQSIHIEPQKQNIAMESFTNRRSISATGW